MKREYKFTCEICNKAFTDTDWEKAQNDCAEHESSHQKPNLYDSDKIEEMCKFDEDMDYDTRSYLINSPVCTFKYKQGSARPTVVYLYFEREDGSLVKIPYRNSNPNVVAEGKIEDEKEDE